MRKIFFLIIAFLCLSVSYAAAPLESTPLQASQIFIPIGKTGQRISYAQLATISMKDLQTLTGKKMNMIERLGFKSIQSKLRRSINEDGTINSKKIQKLVKKSNGGENSGIGGFALGFFLGLIGVLIAYLINDRFKRNRVKWAWIGLFVFIILYILLIVAIFA